jgi:hypothetical protein
MPAFVCDRCALTFDAAEPRCPKCLRKSTVRAEGAPRPSTELAADEATGVPLGLRITFLLAACAQWVAIAGVLVWAWEGLARVHLDVPAALSFLFGAGTSIRLAGRMEADAARPWRSFAKWTGGATLAALWLFVSSVLALAMTRELSWVVAVIVALGIFFAGAVPAFTWALRREVEAERAAGTGPSGGSGTSGGKWRRSG